VKIETKYDVIEFVTKTYIAPKFDSDDQYKNALLMFEDALKDCELKHLKKCVAMMKREHNSWWWPTPAALRGWSGVEWLPHERAQGYRDN